LGLATKINIFFSEFLRRCSQGSATLFDNARFQMSFKLSWYFFMLFFSYAWCTSPKYIWGTLNRLSVGLSKQGKV